MDIAASIGGRMTRHCLIHDRLHVRCKGAAEQACTSCGHDHGSAVHANYFTANEGGVESVGGDGIEKTMRLAVLSCPVLPACLPAHYLVCLRKRAKEVHDRPQMTDPSSPAILSSHIALELGTTHTCDIATRWTFRFTLLAAPIISNQRPMASRLPYLR
jgi:hypothetical protein